MATHSSILAWRFPWTEELGRLQSIGSPGVKYDRATFTSEIPKAGRWHRRRPFFASYHPLPQQRLKGSLENEEILPRRG